jgi:hypothetical protein
VSRLDGTREWVDEQIRELVRMYLAGEMSRDELRMRVDGVLKAAGVRRQQPDRKGVAIGRP